MIDSYASEITWLFQKFNEMNIDYCILRNYEKLPVFDGHDLDVLVNKKSWVKIKKIIKQLNDDFHLFNYKHIPMPYANRYYYNRADTNQNLIIDFHYNEQWMGAIYLYYSQIPKRNFKNFIVAEHYIQPLLPFLNFYLSTGSINAKYYRSLHEYAIQHIDGLINILSYIMPEYVKDDFIYLLINGKYKNDTYIVGKIRLYIFLKSFIIDPIGTFKRFIETIVKLLWFKKILCIYPP